MLLWPQRDRAFVIQRLGDAAVPVAADAQLENATHDRGFGLVDLPLDVRAPAAICDHDVVVRPLPASHIAVVAQMRGR